MKVYKNLMGDGSKIHAGEIALKVNSKATTLDEVSIIESGVSTNGRWYKYADGRMVAVGYVYLDASGWQTPASGGHKGLYKGVYTKLPVVFKNVSGVVGTINGGDGGYRSPWVTVCHVNSSDYGEVRVIVAQTPTATTGLTVYYEVRGTWK